MSTETASSSPIKFTWLIGILAAFAIFAVIAGYSGHMTRTYPSYDQQRAADRYVTLKKLRAEENATKSLNATRRTGSTRARRHHPHSRSTKPWPRKSTP